MRLHCQTGALQAVSSAGRIEPRLHPDCWRPVNSMVGSLSKFKGVDALRGNDALYGAIHFEAAEETALPRSTPWHSHVRSQLHHPIGGLMLGTCIMLVSQRQLLAQARLASTTLSCDLKWRWRQETAQSVVFILNCQDMEKEACLTWVSL